MLTFNDPAVTDYNQLAANQWSARQSALRGEGPSGLTDNRYANAILGGIPNSGEFANELVRRTHRMMNPRVGYGRIGDDVFIQGQNYGNIPQNEADAIRGYYQDVKQQRAPTEIMEAWSSLPELRDYTGPQRNALYELGFGMSPSEEAKLNMQGERLNIAQRKAEMDSIRNQLKRAASAFGMDDIYPFLQKYSQEMGGAQIPDFTKPSGEVIPGRFISAPQERFNAMAGLWSQANPNLPVETLPQRAARQTAEQQERGRLEAELRIRESDAARQAEIDKQTMYARNEQAREAKRREIEQNPLVPFFARPMSAPSMPYFSWMRNLIPPGMAGY